MHFDEDNVFFQELIAHISTNPSGVVPFVGAGLSRYGHPSNQLPGWYDLIQRLKQHCDDLGLLNDEDVEKANKYIAEANFISITDFLVERLGEPLFRQFVRRELDVSGKEISPAIIDLVMVSWSLIVTTNLDNFLETAYTNQTKEIPNIVTARQLPELTDAISGASNFGTISIAKIHGTLSDAKSWALTASHYKNLLASPQYLAALKTLFMKRIFFIGFGLSDDDFDLVQDYLAKLFPEGVGDFYALVPSSTRGGEILNKLIRERGLKPIFYKVGPQAESDPWGGHGGVGQCLSALAKVWSNSRSDLPITLKYFPELEPFFVGRDGFIRELANRVLVNRKSVQVIGFGGEGKTTVVQHWLKAKHFDIRDAGFEEVFGFSFYHASVEHFINDAFSVLCKGETEISISRRLKRLIEELRLRPILFVLDGLEITVDSHGNTLNPDFQRFLGALDASASRVVCTSRIPINFSFEQMDLLPLRPEDARQFFQDGEFTFAEDRELFDRTGGHALSLRVLKSLIDERTFLGVSQIDHGDALDPLSGNKLKRVLDYYGSVLEQSERDLLTCMSIFQGPVSYTLLEKVSTTSYDDSDANSSLIGIDLRRVVYELLSKRLLVTVSGDLLSTHPNVRNYFGSLVGSSALVPLHRQAAFETLRQLPATDPSDLEQCTPFLDAAYHCCMGQLWSEFQYVFKERLNRGNQNFLANVISAWSDFGRLSGLCLELAGSERSIDLAYYAACKARALKHLGHHKEVDQAYSECITLCAYSKTPETARYLNNWMTHHIYIGNLDTALAMVRWNYGLLDWPQEEYHRRWQEEHADLSFAWLSGLLGDVPQALELFNRAPTAWVGFEGGHLHFFDALSNVEAEFLVSQKVPNFDRARERFNLRLDLSLERNWREATIRALVSGAYVERAALSTNAICASSWEHPLQLLSRATEIDDQVGLPTSRLLLVLEQLRVALDMRKAGETAPWDEDLGSLIDLARQLLERTGWDLYRPEFLALSGRIHVAQGNANAAKRALKECLDCANDIGNLFSLMAPFQSFQALTHELRLSIAPPKLTKSVSEIASSIRPKVTGAMLKEACDSGFSKPVLPHKLSP